RRSRRCRHRRAPRLPHRYHRGSKREARMGRLEGKVGLITGGAGAIGRATARRFAAEGASVVVADRDETRAEEVAAALRTEGGGQALGLAVDVTSDASVAAMVGQAVAAYARIDILFTCAGVLVSGSVTETSLADWERTLAVNLTGPFLASRHVVPVMLANGGGSIVHMSSTAGLVGETSIAAYCASKGGVLMLARQMALDYARQGVRVNVICPGWIDTPFNDPAIDAAGGKEALQPFVDQMVPIGRQGTPDEVADVVAFLASDEARLMTGAIVTVDGGLTAQ
ncbi:MAG TPA: SDR family oxidoreductase, partial [Candidatus Binatia bacterium]|nr:SDR family oxidoreductase [Candidatus Binatia bacterium]